MKSWLVFFKVVYITTFINSAARKTNIRNYPKIIIRFLNIQTKNTSVIIKDFLVNQKYICVVTKDILVNQKHILVNTKNFLVNTKHTLVNIQHILVNTLLMLVNQIHILVSQKHNLVNTQHILVNTNVFYLVAPSIHGNSFTKTNTVACGILPVYARIRYLAGGGCSR